MKESPITSSIGFLIDILGLRPGNFDNSIEINGIVSEIPGIVETPVYDGSGLPPNDQSSGQGTGQGTGSGISGGDNPFGNWDGNNNAANPSTSSGSFGSDMNNNGIPDDIDALLGGR